MGEDEKPWQRKDRWRRWADESKSEFPSLPYENTRFSIKQVAYLHAYLGKEPRDIVARYPRVISLAQVHLALAHYFADREKFDREITKDLEFDRNRSLHEASMTLPSMRAPKSGGPRKDVGP